MLTFFLLFAAIAAADARELGGRHKQSEPYSFNVPELREYQNTHNGPQTSLSGIELVLGSGKIIVPAGQSMVIPEWAERPRPLGRTFLTKLPLDPITYPTTPLENEDYLGEVITTHPFTPLPDEERTTATGGEDYVKEETTTAAQEESTTAMTPESELPRGAEEEEFTPILEDTTIAPVW